MYHGSDTMYRKWCAYKGELKNGKRTDGATLKPGTAVFCWNGTKYSHVGLYIGNGYVIEAASTVQGVIKTKVTASKWKYWGELKGVDYEKASDQGGQPPEADEKDDALPTIRRGDKGPYVTKAQTALKQRGYSLGSAGIDGDFGKATEAAVKQFQRDWGLDADGVIGPKTWKMLESTPAKQTTYTVTIKGLSRDKAQALCKQYAGSSMKEE